MSIPDAFSRFCANLFVMRRDAIDQRLDNLSRRLSRDYWSGRMEEQNCLVFGSFGRYTAIRETPFVDILVRYPAQSAEDFIRELPNAVKGIKEIAHSTFPDMKAGQSDIRLQASFSDRTQMNIFPAYLHEDGRFLFPHPDGGNKPLLSPMQLELNTFHELNRECNNNLALLCRMLRAWKLAQKLTIPGFVIDAMAYYFIGDWEHRDKSYMYFDFLCRDFFAYLNQNNATEWQLPGSRQVITVEPVDKELLSHCHILALQAIEADRQGMARTARRHWGEIFGESFPS